MKKLYNSVSTLIVDVFSSHTNFQSSSTSDLYHAYRNLDTNSLHDSNNINQNFSSQPYFDFSVARNVTTRVGQTAFLNCRVEQLSDKLVSFFMSFVLSDKNRIMSCAILFNLDELSRLSIEAINVWQENYFLFLSHVSLQVSWIRKRDLHILSAGLSTYTSDERFQVNYYRLRRCVVRPLSFQVSEISRKSSESLKDVRVLGFVTFMLILSVNLEG